MKELRLRGIDNIQDGNDYLNEFMTDFNARFAKSPLNPKDVHRQLADHEDLEQIFTWQESRTVTNSLTVQYDRVVYLLEPNDITLDLRRKKIRIYDYPDGTIEIRYDGLPLPYTVFDKVRQVKQAEVVSNKRLGAVLQFIQEEQTKKSVERSKKAPTRRGQKQIVKQRQLNSAVTSSL